MLRKALRQIRKNPINGWFLVIGYAAAILIVSLGTSRIMENRRIIEDAKLNNKNLINANLALTKNIDFNKTFNILKDVSKTTHISVKVPVDIGEDNTKWAMDGVIFSREEMKDIPLIKGRYFTPEEGKSDKKIAVVGETFSHRAFEENGEEFILLNGEKYKIIGVVGVTNRNTLWDPLILVPINAISDNLKNDLNIGMQMTLRSFDHVPEEEIKKIEIDYKLLDENSRVTYSKASNAGMIQQSMNADSKGITKQVMLILLLAIINVINVSAYWLYDRKQEIAIRKMAGATEFNVFKIVFSEFTGISILGALIGLILQIMISIFKPSFFQLNMLSRYVTVMNFVIAFIVTFLCGMITSVIPLKFILNMQPAEAMKN